MAAQVQAQAGALPSSEPARLLNAIMRNQLTSTNQVFLNSFILEHWGFHRCAERMYVESVRETRRSMRSLRHLTLLGIEPELSATAGLYSMARPVVGRNLGEVFQIEKAHARQSLAAVQQAIAAYEAIDEPATLAFLRPAAAGQAEYIDWLTNETDALRELGTSRYLEGQGAALQDGDLKAFLAKVRELSARDPDFADVSDPVAPAARPADGRILGWLNELLAIEIMSIERDFVDAFLFDRRGIGPLTDRIVTDALGAMRRAQRITEHILGLGETPAPDATSSAGPLPPAGARVEDYLETERHLEEWKSSVARDALASDLPPGPTRALVAALLRQSEGRAAWLSASVRDRPVEDAPTTPAVRFQAMLQRWGVPA